jgi:hypothetical protein
MPEASTYPCPSCGFLVFDEPSGSYDICPICNWEDDHVQLAHPIMRGGTNSGSLLDYQQRIIAQLPPDVREYGDYKRHSDWRPLTEADYAPDGAAPKSGSEYFSATTEAAQPYYWQNS